MERRLLQSAKPLSSINLEYHFGKTLPPRKRWVDSETVGSEVFKIGSIDRFSDISWKGIGVHIIRGFEVVGAYFFVFFGLSFLTPPLLFPP